MDPGAETRTAGEPAAARATKKDIQSSSGTPLSRLLSELPSIIKETEYAEMWGVELKDSADIPTTIVLTKFLRANNNDVASSKAQLTDALNWRKRMQPAKLLEDTSFDKAKFGGLGYITMYPTTEGYKKEIVIWNLYSDVKDNKETFGNVEEFVKWRIALVELSLKELSLSTALIPIPEDGTDPYQMILVHDYINIRLRMDPLIGAASKQFIDTSSMAYPELLKQKFFVNIPVVMSWAFSAIKFFLSAATARKFRLLSYGSALAGEIPEIGEMLPQPYGGKGGDLKSEGITVKYADADAKAINTERISGQ